MSNKYTNEQIETVLKEVRLSNTWIRIGAIGNYYGDLRISRDPDDDHWYWCIENYDGEDWEKIPDYLAEALLKFEEERKKMHE